MTTDQTQAYRSWEKLLNPEILQGNLIVASLFLASYELLRSSIIDQRRDFYICGFNAHGETVSPNYQAKVISRDKSPLRASLLWLKEAQVIDDSDIDRIQQIRAQRNEIAHNLVKLIGSSGAEIDTELFEAIFDLVAKVDRWWIREVELECNPEFDGIDGRDIPDAEIHSGRMIALTLLIGVATGEDSGRFYREYVKQASMKPKPCETQAEKGR